MTNQRFDGRYTTDHDDEIVVFFLGAMVHKPWKVRQWVRVARAMNAMQREIVAHPEIGCLGTENYGSLRSISVQYWRSFEHLERFARSNDWSHLAAWREFNRLIGDSGDLGIWHETYRVPAEHFETIYTNMPRMGLAAATGHRPLHPTSTAASRLRHTDPATS